MLEEDRKRTREDEEVEMETYKKMRIEGDVDGISEEDWERLMDDIWEKRTELLVIPLSNSNRREDIHINRACTLAEIQDRAGITS